MVPGLIAFSVTFLAYYIGYEGLHYLMHKPRFAFIENSGFFRFIKHHHAIHHVRMNKNLNVVLPIADFCLGTLVLEMPDLAAKPTGERAKFTARQHSRFGRQLREDEQEKRASGAGSR
jgi:sterol desaturase/sphingolipid hydroxylase (fatty acid hydroxylase superfamily)